MKFRVVEHKRTPLEPELDATPYFLTDEEQKAVVGGYGCTCYGNADSCGGRRGTCKPRTSSGGGICENYSWAIEISVQE